MFYGRVSVYSCCFWSFIFLFNQASSLLFICFRKHHDFRLVFLLFPCPDEFPLSIQQVRGKKVAWLCCFASGSFLTVIRYQLFTWFTRQNKKEQIA